MPDVRSRDQNADRDNALSAAFLSCVAIAAVAVFAGAWFYAELKITASTLLSSAVQTITTDTAPEHQRAYSSDDSSDGPSTISGRQMHGRANFSPSTG